jgi:hypothetical protein
VLTEVVGSLNVDDGGAEQAMSAALTGAPKAGLVIDRTRSFCGPSPLPTDPGATFSANCRLRAGAQRHHRATQFSVAAKAGGLRRAT